MAPASLPSYQCRPRSAASRSGSNERVKKADVQSGRSAGVPTEMADKLKALNRERCELRQVSEILRKASLYLAMATHD